VNLTQAKRLLKLADYLAAHREPGEGEEGVGFDMNIVFSSDHDLLELKQSEWRQRHPCGSAACVIGHAGLMPEFQKLGLVANGAGPGGGAGEIALNGNAMSLPEAGQMFFGLSQDEGCDLFLDGFDMTAAQKAIQIRVLVRNHHPDLFPLAKKGPRS